MSGRAVSRLLVLAVAALTLGQGLRTTAGLSWPPDEDLDRDVAQARTMADGAWLADPFYRGESVWYNPLGPAILAAFSRITAIPTHEASVRLGPWLGLAAPLGFAVLATALIGRWGGVAALVAFVFVTPGRLPALLCATYSPWPFGAQVAQGPFYLGLAALAMAAQRRSLPQFALAGALLGLAFLTHTASALLLGITGLAVTLAGTPGSIPLRGRLARLVVLLAAAVVVASPFLWSICVRYRLRIVNAAPGSWTWPATGAWPATGDQSLGAAIEGAVGRPLLLGLVLVGFGILLSRHEGREGTPAGRRIVAAWLVGSVVFLAYALAQPVLARSGLGAVPLVPAFHFWSHLGALASLFAGCGCRWLGERVSSRLAAEPGRRARVSAFTTVAVAVGLALVALPSWRQRSDFVDARQLAEFHGSRSDRTAAHRWVRDHTSPDDVFLAEHDLGVRVVATAGRKLVAVDRNFSNPYVAWEPRAAASERMFALLVPGGHPAFHPLAIAYRVSYIIVERQGPQQPWPDAPFLVPVFQEGDVVIYRTGCWPE